MIRHIVSLAACAAVLPWTLGAASAQLPAGVSLTVTPERPTHLDPLRLTGMYATSCLQDQRVFLDGNTLRLVAVEGCVCPLSPAEPVAVSVEIPPLPHGVYTLEFALERWESGLQCEPAEILAERPLLVTSTGLVSAIETESTPHAEGAFVTLHVQLSKCFYRLRDRGRHGEVLPFSMNAVIFDPPCEPGPYEESVDLGFLPGGEYLLTFERLDPGGTVLETVHRFSVEGAPGPSGGRLRGLPSHHFPPQSFDIRPPFPTAEDTVRTTVETFVDCNVGQRSEIEGDELRLIVQRGCNCPPALPVPVTVEAEFGPLWPGEYKVVYGIEEFGETPPGGPPCRPGFRTVETHDLLVSREGVVLEAQILPAAPRAGDDVALDLRFNPLGLDEVFTTDPGAEGPILWVRGNTPPFDPVPVEPEWSRSLGSRRAGQHFILITRDDRFGPPTLETVLSFRVHPRRTPGGEPPG